MNSTRKVFAQRLRKYRQYLGFSQRIMAEKLGCAKTTIINWEKFDGLGQPTWEQIDRMCSWTGLEPIYFFISDEFSSDSFDIAEQIKGLPVQVQEALSTLIRHSTSSTLN